MSKQNDNCNQTHLLNFKESNTLGNGTLKSSPRKIEIKDREECHPHYNVTINKVNSFYKYKKWRDKYIYFWRHDFYT